MLQPFTPPPTPQQVPAPATIVPRPPTQEQNNSSARNITRAAVTQSDETGEIREDTEDQRLTRVEAERQTRGFRGRGERIDILV